MNNYLNYQNSFTGREPKNYIKKYFSSPMCLSAAILCLASVVLSFIANIFINGDDILNKLLSIFGKNISYFYDYYDYYELSSDLSLNSGRINIISIMMIIALFLLYFQSRSKKSGTCPKASFVIFQVLAILGIIVASFASLIVLMFSVLFVVLLSAYGFGYPYSDFFGATSLNSLSLADELEVASSFAIVMVIIASVIFILILIAVFMYYISFNSYAKSLKKGLSEPYLYVKGAKVFGVLSIIIGVLSIIGNIGIVLLDITSVTSDIILLVSALCYGAYQIIFGLMAVKYVKYATEVNQQLYEQYQAYAQNNYYVYNNNYKVQGNPAAYSNNPPYNRAQGQISGYRPSDNYYAGRGMYTQTHEQTDGEVIPDNITMQYRTNEFSGGSGEGQ